MTNGEKYKTAQERAEAYEKFCSVIKHPFDSTGCDGCELHRAIRCEFFWLDLEAEEEKPLPCYECGKERIIVTCKNGTQIGFAWHIECNYCAHTSGWYKTKKDAIAAHNRVAKKCREVKE